MGLMTLGDFRTDVQTALGGRGYDNTKLDRWINSAYFDIAGSVDFEDLDDTFSVTTVAGTALYAGPARPLAVKFVYDETNDVLLGWIPKHEYYRLDRATQGTPKKWTRDAGNIALHPTPSGALAMRVVYKKEPTELINVGDTTVLPKMWDFAIFLLAVRNGLLAAGEEDRAVVWFNMASAYIQSRLSEDKFEASSPTQDLTLPRVGGPRG